MKDADKQERDAVEFALQLALEKQRESDYAPLIAALTERFLMLERDQQKQRKAVWH